MATIDNERLPFNIRPDLTPYLVHLTKRGNHRSALDNLEEILRDGVIKGTSTYVKGQRKATCFMDVPFVALKYVCSRASRGRYEPYGLVISKLFAYRRRGARPVLYLSAKEERSLRIPKDDLWRVVKLQYSPRENAWKSNWLHEREWRCPDEFVLPEEIRAVLVKTSGDAMKLQKRIDCDYRNFACIPRSILPLQVICQGLDY